ncbi:uncharacterized protein LOC122368962, partial [Amphibalanus amphitrite]|uniref:uncharacterized protein LOC122368962 n=1 Tax=Amphibalanus amphitrite TaxID=1232801 RepID=UPI001C8FE84C
MCRALLDAALAAALILCLQFRYTVSQVPSLVKRDCMMDYWGWLYAGDESVTYFDRECQNWITRRGNHKVDPKLEFYDPGAKARPVTSADRPSKTACLFDRDP